jgi:hypothetical protein
VLYLYSVFELDDDASHVVLAVLGELVSRHVRHRDNLQVLFHIGLQGWLLSKVVFVKLLVHDVDHALRGARVPETVACQDDKFVLGISLHNFDVGNCSNGLVFLFNALLSLEEKIANSS